MMSYVYLGLGFFFYASHFPECFFTKERVGSSVSKFVQLYLPSHMFWHIFTAANGYALYTLSLEAIVFYDKILKERENKVGK